MGEFVRALLFILLAAPVASASGTLSAGPLVAQLENGHRSDCMEDVSGLCVASVAGDDVGSLDLNAHQAIRYVGVAVNESFRRDVHAIAGMELLPGGELVGADASTVDVHHPGFILLAEHVGRAAVLWLAVAYVDEEDGWGWGYYGPRVYPLDPTFAPRVARYTWTESGTDYEAFRGFHEIVAESDSDVLVEGYLTTPCNAVGSDACRRAAMNISQEFRDLTPRASFSLAFYELEAAGSSDVLGPDGRLLDRALPPDPLGPRAAVDPPHSSPPQVPTGHGSVSPHPRGGDPPSPALPRPPGGWSRAGPDPAPNIPPAPPGPLAPTILLASAAFALAVLAAALYSRITRREDLLLRARRADLLRLVEERGPLPIVEAARALALDRTTVCYHARMLARAGRLRVVRHGKSALLALREQQATPASPACAADRVLAIVRAQGGVVPRRALAALVVDMPKRTLSYALRDLSERGLVERVQREGEPLVRLRETSGAA